MKQHPGIGSEENVFNDTTQAAGSWAVRGGERRTAGCKNGSERNGLFGREVVSTSFTRALKNIYPVLPRTHPHSAEGLQVTFKLPHTKNNHF
jgi:hypothetical protein